MKPIYVILCSGTSGGTGTLSIRLGERLVNRGCKVLFICREYTDVNNVQLMENVGIKVSCVQDNEVCSYLLTECGELSNFVFLTYTLEQYLLVERFKTRLNITKNIMYVVHFYGLVMTSSHWMVRDLRKQFYRKLVKKMLECESVVFMDDQTLEETQKFYDISEGRDKNLVFYLPIETRDIDTSKIEDKSNRKTFNILTIARADFPFKGYIIGLIDDFSRLCDSHDNLTLTIISFGIHQNRISQKIGELPERVRRKIDLIGQTPYDKLPDYFDMAHTYIGMGTTILDAVNCGVPSIPVQPYTYECNSSGFFHQQPGNLASYEPSRPSYHYVEQVINMSVSEYVELCEVEHRALVDCYDIDRLATHLMNMEERRETMTIGNLWMTGHLFLSGFLSMLAKVKRTLLGRRH